jgi:hypothetical protein
MIGNARDGSPSAGGELAALRARLTRAVEAEFGDDRKRIDHALRVLQFAERILEKEPGEPRVVMAAALLHDIGIRRAEEVHGSSAARYQEREGPPIARCILEQAGFEEPDIEHVCRIVAYHHSGGMDTPEFRIIWDADWLVNLPDVYAGAEDAAIRRAIERVFKTPAGAALARAEHLGRPGNPD